MLRRSRASKPAQSRPSGKKLDILNAIDFKDQRVARAVYGLPWEHFYQGRSPLTAAKLTTVVRMLEALNLSGEEQVLDVATGGGYRAALLGCLAAKVYSIELLRNVAAEARTRLALLGRGNVEVIEGDGSRGWTRAAPYQAILVGCASPDIPHELIGQLDQDGRLVIPVGDARGQLLERVRRRGAVVEMTTIGPCDVTPLAFRGERRSSVPWLRLS